MPLGADPTIKFALKDFSLKRIYSGHIERSASSLYNNTYRNKGLPGSLGLLVKAVPIDRIVTAMVVWSQIGIVGYLLGPLAGGIAAEGAATSTFGSSGCGGPTGPRARPAAGPARMTDIQLNDPQTLYRRWEDSQWSPFDVDLAADQEQWPALTGGHPEIIYSRCRR